MAKGKSSYYDEDGRTKVGEEDEDSGQSRAEYESPNPAAPKPTRVKPESKFARQRFGEDYVPPEARGNPDRTYAPIAPPQVTPMPNVVQPDMDALDAAYAGTPVAPSAPTARFGDAPPGIGPGMIAREDPYSVGRMPDAPAYARDIGVTPTGIPTASFARGPEPSPGAGQPPLPPARTMATPADVAQALQPQAPAFAQMQAPPAPPMGTGAELLSPQQLMALRAQGVIR